MRKRTAYLAVITLFAATLAASGPLAAQTDSAPEPDRRSTPERVTGSVADAFAPRDLNEEVHVFIQLDEPSVAEAAGDGAGPAAQRAQGQSVLRQQSQIESDLTGLIQGEPLANMVVGANGFRAIARVGDIPAIRAVDGVLSVAQVTRYYPTNESSVPWIGGSAAQSSGFTGDGLTIAVIDTGIDYTHASFGGSGDPNDYDDNDPGTVEPGTFPTAKIVTGFDFAGPVYDASDPDLDTPSPDSDPLDVHGHGTHVAATAAGVDVTGDLEEGMAPDAELMALKVFGDIAGSTDVVSDAIEFALDPNNDLSIDDAADVINMSLGSPFGHPDDPSAIASANAADLGVTVVASAGNEGPVPYITGSPAVANGVISVAASVDGGVEVLGLVVNSPVGIADTYEAQPGDFGPLSPPTQGDLAIAEPLDACDPITSDVDGDIALIQRGTCDFTVKIREAQDAGAIGALVFNNVEGPPIAMGQNGTPNQPTIPAMMVDLADGQLILDTAETETVNVTLTDTITIPKPGLADTMADFTSQGPGFGNVFKPDLSAPGFNIGSADVGTGTDLTLSSGTSMAAPHVAGAAAQLLEAHPGLTPAEVKALLMNSATPAEPDGSVPISRQGTGVIHIDRAASDLGGYTMPAGLAFHLNPTAPTTESQTVDISRLADDEVTYDVEIVDNQSLPGVTWDVSADTVTTTGGTGSVDVSVSADPTAMDADDGFFSQAESDGWLVLTNDSDPDDSIVVGLVAVADPASDVEVAGGEDVVAVANDGPASGFADGFTKVSAGDGSLAAVGYRTGFVPADQGGPYATIDLGIALSTPWAHPSANEIDVFIDTDQDGTDDYAIVAADLGVLSGVDPTGDVVTAIFTLDGSQPPALLYFTFADMNDQVIVLPADLTGDFGFLADDDSTFDITTMVFDQLGVAGASETVTVDLEDEVTAEGGLSLALPPGASGEVATSGEGEMLWLYQNDGVPEQFQTTSVTTAEEEEPPPPPPPPPPPGETPSFTDVPDDHLFHTEITWLAEQGITRGCNPPDNDRFCPDDSVTRGQMAAFMNRGLGLPATTVDYFDDDTGNVFEMDINELAESGITRGCNPPVNDEFCPERTITRAEMATFMVLGFDFVDGAGDDLFVDDDESVHESDIDILGTAGVTKGCNPPVNDEYCPGRDITRGEMAAFIFRAFQAAGLED